MKRMAMAPLAFALLMLGACASRPPVEYDRQADFSAYRTFQWLDPRHGEGDVSLSHPVLDSPLLTNRVERAVANVLESKGYRQVEENADFMVTYHTAQAEREYRGSYMQLGYGHWGRRWGSGVVVDMWPRTFQEGTLIIDIVDARSGDLVWRGWRDSELTRRNFDQERVSEAVQFVLSEFPPESP